MRVGGGDRWGNSGSRVQGGGKGVGVKRGGYVGGPRGVRVGGGGKGGGGGGGRCSGVGVRVSTQG